MPDAAPDAAPDWGALLAGLTLAELVALRDHVAVLIADRDREAERAFWREGRWTVRRERGAP